MATQGEDQKLISDAATPVTIPSGSTTINLPAMFANFDGGGINYVRALVNPSATTALTVTVSRINDSKILSPGVTTG